MTGAASLRLVETSDGSVAATGIAALKAHLGSIRDLLERIGPASYRAAPSGVSGSIGGHVRHCLDHVDALLEGAYRPEMSYDSRRRGTLVEIDPCAAMIEIDRLCVELDAVAEGLDDRRIDLRCVVQRDAAPLRVTTSIGREVAFAIQHTVHHCAILAILLDRLEIAVPDGFGYAPTTPTIRAAN
jgi:hypothetical protein